MDLILTLYDNSTFDEQVDWALDKLVGFILQLI
jgi:hypothetical protein